MRKHAVSCGSGWSVPCVSIQLTLSQNSKTIARLGVEEGVGLQGCLGFVEVVVVLPDRYATPPSSENPKSKISINYIIVGYSSLTLKGFGEELFLDSMLDSLSHRAIPPPPDADFEPCVLQTIPLCSRRDRRGPDTSEIHGYTRTLLQVSFPGLPSMPHPGPPNPATSPFL